MFIGFRQHPLAPGDTSKKYVVADSSGATISRLQLVEKWWKNVNVDSCWAMSVDLGWLLLVDVGWDELTKHKTDIDQDQPNFSLP